MNRWAKHENESEGEGWIERLRVPSNVAAPRCTFCGGEIRETTMGLIVWNDEPAASLPFDGFHLAHKIECDPGRRAGDDFRMSVELSSTFREPADVVRFCLHALEISERHAPLTAELQANVASTVGIAIALGLASIDMSENELAHWPEIIANQIENF